MRDGITKVDPMYKYPLKIKRIRNVNRLKREATLRSTIYEHLKLVLHREPSRQEIDEEFRKMNGETLYIPAPISRGKYHRMEILKL